MKVESWKIVAQVGSLVLAPGCASVVIDDRSVSSESVASSSTGVGGASSGSVSPSGGTASDSSGTGGMSGANDCTAPNVTLLASEQYHPSKIALDATSVYWANIGVKPGSSEAAHIFSVPKSGGTPKEIATATGVVRALMADGTNVYWAGHELSLDAVYGSIYSVPKAGGPVTQLFTWKDKFFITIILDDQHFYWVDGAGVIRSLPTSGGDATVVAWGPAEKSVVNGLVVSQDRIYWRSKDDLLRSASKLGGDAQAVTELSASAWIFTVDDERAYWVAQPEGPGENPDTIYAKPKGGVGAVSIFQEADGAMELQHRGPCLYWRNGIDTPGVGFGFGWRLNVAKKSGGPRSSFSSR